MNTAGAFLLIALTMTSGVFTDGLDDASRIQGFDVSETDPTTDQILIFDGSEWAPGDISVEPGGSDGQIQYNDGGDFGGDAALVWDDANQFMGINTSGPDRRLDILDDTNPQLRLSNVDGTEYADIFVDSDSYLYLSYAGTEQLIIKDYNNHPYISAKLGSVLYLGTYDTNGVSIVVQNVVQAEFKSTAFSPKGTDKSLGSSGNEWTDLHMSGDIMDNGLTISNGSESIADDGSISDITSLDAIGEVMCNGEYAHFHFSGGTVTLLSNSTNVATSDSDGDLCIYDADTDGDLDIKNRLGAQYDVKYSIKY